MCIVFGVAVTPVPIMKKPMAAISAPVACAVTYMSLCVVNMALMPRSSTVIPARVVTTPPMINLFFMFLLSPPARMIAHHYHSP